MNQARDTTAPPRWAVQRVAAVLDGGRSRGPGAANAVELARRTGLNKRLVRRCLHHLRGTRR